MYIPLSYRTTYGYLGKVGGLRIQWNDNCDHCMVCHDVCFESQVLELTKAKYDKQREEKGIKEQYVTGADCTLCGRCIDVCHSDALKFDFRLKDWYKMIQVSNLTKNSLHIFH